MNAVTSDSETYDLVRALINVKTIFLNDMYVFFRFISFFLSVFSFGFGRFQLISRNDTQFKRFYWNNSYFNIEKSIMRH